MNNEIQRIISGESKVKYGPNIHATLCHLRGSKETSELDKKDKLFKKQETEKLIEYIEKNSFWVNKPDKQKYISEGAEQKVFLKDGSTVIKLNDSIYYLAWEDYLTNLLLNNYFFPDTAYNLAGFYKDDGVLYAVVEQQFIKATQKTNFEHVKQFMERNGFTHLRKYDFYNKEQGVLIEDLHDENVLTNNGLLYFIDTVFYLV